MDTGTGKLVLTPELLATVAGAAAMEVTGVLGTVPRKFKDGLGQVWGQENTGKGCQVGWDGKAIIAEIRVAVGYGHYIPEVAADVVRVVRRRLEEHTGVPVGRVDVLVLGVRREHDGHRAKE